MVLVGITAIVVLSAFVLILQKYFIKFNEPSDVTPSIKEEEEEVKYHIFDGIEGYIQHPKAVGKIVTWEEYLQMEFEVRHYLLFTHKNYHLQKGFSIEQYIIDYYYYPNDFEAKNGVQLDFLPPIYFIDLSDPENYEALYDEENGILVSQHYPSGICSIENFKLATYPVIIAVGRSATCGGDYGYFSQIVGDLEIRGYYLANAIRDRVNIRQKYTPDDFDYDKAFEGIEWRKQYKKNVNKY